MAEEMSANVSLRVTVASPVAVEACGGLAEQLLKRAGIHQVEIEGDGIGVHVTYDRAWTDFEGVAWAFAEEGYPLRADAWARLKGGWYARQDRKARTIGKLPDSACCGQPPAFDRRQDR